VGLKVGKGDTIVNSSADTLTTGIYDFGPICGDVNRTFQIINRVGKKSLKGFIKTNHQNKK